VQAAPVTADGVRAAMNPRVHGSDVCLVIEWQGRNSEAFADATASVASFAAVAIRGTSSR